MQSQRVEDPHFTYGDYVQWEGDERWELIDGEAYLMSPAPNRAHQQVLALLSQQVLNHFEDKPCNVYFAPFDVRFPKSNEDDEDVDTVLQPDLVVFCDPEKLDEAGARGAPDWVVEILSPATSSRDRVAKKAVYERYGVREYWVLDPKSAEVWVHELVDGAYEIREARGQGEWGPLIFPDLMIRWNRIFAS